MIFGATGDLAKRKLLPALYNLAHEGSLPERFNLIGVSRSGKSDENFRSEMREAVEQFSRTPPNREVLEALLENVRYVAGSFDDPAVYEGLRKQIEGVRRRRGPRLQPRLLPLHGARVLPGDRGGARRGQAQPPQGAEVRVVIEKPFGYDLESARQLNRQVLRVFRERQVYRIDHYLGKETVQNMLAFRFANSMFEPVWNRNYIDYVQITAAEDLGIGTRAGLLRPLRRAPRPRPEPHAPAARTARHGASDRLQRRPGAQREGQGHAGDSPAHAGGGAADGGARPVRAGRDRRRARQGLPGGGRRSPDSFTETYAALRLSVNNWRWSGVPIYLRTGKRLARKLTEIAVTLKPVPHLAFQEGGSLGVQPNQLILTVQPDEGVSLSLGAKIPGARMRIRPVNMEFRYGTAFLSQSPEAYERLILDAMRGEALLFTRDDEVEALWSIIDPILAEWKREGGPIPQYPAGSQGPEEAEKLLAPGHRWRAL